MGKVRGKDTRMETWREDGEPEVEMVRCEGASKEWRRVQTGCGERERRDGDTGTARNTELKDCAT